MNTVDDIFANAPAPQGKMENGSFDKEKWAERKKQEREEVFAMIDQAAADAGVDEGVLRGFLDVQSRFDRYSVGNALLINLQMPEATKLADFDTWKKSGVYIRKHSSPILLLEPGNSFTKGDGSTGVSWDVKKVFDISQTTARRPELPANSLDERTMLRALIHNAPCAMKLADTMPERVNARYDPKESVILLRRGLDAATAFRELSRELAMAHMNKDNAQRGECIFAANCVSYILCHRNGLPVDGFSFDRKPEGFSQRDSKAVRMELEKVRDVANRITSDMRQFLEADRRKEKKRDDSAR